jgi:hypothetical protein
VSQRTLGNACRSTVGEAIGPKGRVVFAEIISALIRVSAGTETDPRALNHNDEGLGPLAAARWGVWPENQDCAPLHFAKGLALLLVTTSAKYLLNHTIYYAMRQIFKGFDYGFAGVWQDHVSC